MRQTAGAILVLMILALSGTAQDEPASRPAAQPDRVAVMTAIETEYQEALAAFYARIEAAKDDAEREAIFAAGSYPRGEDYADRIWALVDANPRDAAAIKGLTFVLLETHEPANRDRARDLFLAHHLESTEIVALCDAMSMGGVPSQGNLDALEILVKKSPHHAVRGKALWAETALLSGALGVAQHLASESVSAEDVARTTEFYGAETIAWLKSLDAKVVAARREKILETIAADYEDLTLWGDQTLAQAAQAELFEIRNLGVGKKAPEIVGKDADGVEFKLSDYRGKVVVLDFWGYW